jgi:hypothetical protein
VQAQASRLWAQVGLTRAEVALIYLASLVLGFLRVPR